MDRVDLAPLQAAYRRRLEEGDTPAIIAIRGGFYRRPDRRHSRGQPDVTVLQGRIDKTCSYDTAVRLARALELDPVDIGV
jgi:hypothetical protein